MAAFKIEKDVESPVENMLSRIANSDAVVKSQQRGEPDLTVDEKVTILRGILEKNPGSFLMRFGRCLVEDDLRTFDHLKGDYEIDFRVKEVKNILDANKNKTGVRNRRYECLQRLMKDSDYFSEEKMRKRAPLLYEEYIGQYLTEEEKFERDRAEMGNDPCLSELLMSRQEKEMDEWFLEYQRDQEACMEEEDESDSDGSTEKGDWFVCHADTLRFWYHSVNMTTIRDLPNDLLNVHVPATILSIHLHLRGWESRHSNYKFHMGKLNLEV